MESADAHFNLTRVKDYEEDKLSKHERAFRISQGSRSYGNFLRVVPEDESFLKLQSNLSGEVVSPI